MSNEEDPIAMVMVSNAFAEMPEYRDALYEIIEEHNLAWTSIDYPADMPIDEWAELCLKSVRESDAYIGLERIPADSERNPDQLPVSELESHEAAKFDRPIIFFRQLRSENPRGEVSGPASRFVQWVGFFDLRDFQEKAPAAVAELQAHFVERAKTSSSGQEDESASSPGTPAQEPAVEEQLREVADDSVIHDSASNESSSTRKPLVYISFGPTDFVWPNLLRRALDDRQNEIEWWDGSKSQSGDPYKDRLAMIGRAASAVVLLSPDYLAFKYSNSELEYLATQVKAGKLGIFPIVLQECDWKMEPSLRGVGVWRNGEPVGGMRDTATADELAAIVENIVREAKEFRKSEKRVKAPPLAADLVFSESAQALLDRGRQLAKQSHRTELSSSCLLFAFGEVEWDPPSTIAFAHSYLRHTDAYDNAFATFIQEGVSANPDGSEQGDEPVGIDQQVAATLRAAASIAARVSSESPEISARHLLASLLVIPVASGKVWTRLRTMGIETAGFCTEFLRFITENGLDDLTAWAELLTQKGFQAGTAGYSAEFCGVGRSESVEDHLQVNSWACQLAELIALRETKLPLAIGLFGNWGSGKSHFMNLIDRRLKELGQEEKEAAKTRPPQAEGRWCAEIVPVYFNAWHYLDANLWASLVEQIFERLFEHLRPKNDLPKMEQLLEKASGASARAAEELAIAHSATEKAQQQLAAAKEDRLHRETVVNGLLQGLKKLLPVSPEKLQREIIKLMGVEEQQVKTLDDLRRVTSEAQSLAGRIRALWTTIWVRPGRGWRLGWLVASVLLVPVGLAVGAWFSPFLKDWLQRAGAEVKALLVVVSTFLAWLLPMLLMARQPLKHVESWVKEAEHEQQLARENPAVKKEQRKLDTATAVEQAKKNDLVQKREAEKQLVEEMKNLAPERRLGRFIEQRAQSSDYRGQLGLVSLARKDFQELSDIFANAKVLAARLEKLKTKNDKTDEEDREDKKEAAQIEKLSKSIDRIVLFVDDLDRCQPDKVVEILQAVHLLLAFPLFAVVVGVDQRCLRQSLRMQFKGLLTPEDGSSGAKHGPFNKSLGDDERPATPLDYLEKIFHVPFHLPAMGEKNFETLIDWLSAPNASQANGRYEGSAPAPLPDGADKAGDIPPSVKPVDGKSRTPSSPPDRDLSRPPSVAEDQITAESQKVRESSSPAASTQPVATPGPRISLPLELVGSVPLRQWEREALRAYHQLIQTPRAATRLLNTYRLVRAGVPAQEWNDFSGAGTADGEFRVAMLLLSAAAGYPALAREWFDRLRRTDPGQLFLRDEGLEAESPWLQFKSVYNSTFANVKSPITQDLMIKWIDRVERFAF